MDNGRARTRRSSRAWHAIRESGNRAAHAQKNDLKPWRRVMWCIGELTEEYRARMYALLELYARPISKAEPVICIDEKSLQLIGHSLSLIHISEPTRLGMISYAVFCLKK